MHAHETKLTAVAGLKPHPRNYKEHPESQLVHIMKSIEEHGFYRAVVTANDGTILAGHGVVQAAKKMGLEEVPAISLPVSPEDPRAIKVLVGDNEIGKLGLADDDVLADLLAGLSGMDICRAPANR